MRQDHRGQLMQHHRGQGCGDVTAVGPQVLKVFFRVTSRSCRNVYVTYVYTYIYIYVCMYVCMSVFLSVCLSVFLSVCLSVCMYVCMVRMNIYIYYDELICSLFMIIVNGLYGRKHVERVELSEAMSNSQVILRHKLRT